MGYINTINKILNNDDYLLCYCKILNFNHNNIVLSEDDMLKAIEKVDNKLDLLSNIYRTLHQITYDYIRNLLISERRKVIINSLNI